MQCMNSRFCTFDESATTPFSVVNLFERKKADFLDFSREEFMRKMSPFDETTNCPFQNKKNEHVAEGP